GLGRDKPVGFLMIIIVLGGGMAMAMLCKRATTTAAGESQLNKWQSQNEALRVNLTHNPSGMRPTDLAMAYALFGITAVSLLDPYNAARQALRPQSSSCGGGSCGAGSS